MKKLNSLILVSLFSLGSFGCNTNSSNSLNQVINQNVNASSVIQQNNYPFSTSSDFFPLYNKTTWEYDVFDGSKKSSEKPISSLTKVLDTNDLDTLNFDKKNDYYTMTLIKKYSNKVVRDKNKTETFRRRKNKVAYGKTDRLGYYPSSKNYFDPNAFRPFLEFPKSRLKKITVKAGTFDCIEASFSVAPLDEYTIWYAQGIGEVKREVKSSFYHYRYELSSFNSSKEFIINNTILPSKEAPKDILSNAVSIRNEFLTLNDLPENLFEQKSDSIFTDTKIKYNHKSNSYEITFINKGLLSSNNINLNMILDEEGNPSIIQAFGSEKNKKAKYGNQIIDKIPAIIKKKD